MPNPLDVEVDGPEPGETCECGAPAAWVYVTPDLGRVPRCGDVPDALPCVCPQGDTLALCRVHGYDGRGR